MHSKRFAAQAQKAEKEKQTMIEKARREMKKNNEDMAKMFLNQAALKQNESINSAYLSFKFTADEREDGDSGWHHQ